MEEERHERTLFATVESHEEFFTASRAADHELYERKLFATFERHGEFSNAQRALLAVDLFEEPAGDGRQEYETFRRISAILDEYQEQSYLLDPFLEQLVVPVVERLKEFAKEAALHPDKPGSTWRVDRLAMLLYSYIKCRGCKTIIRFFPHDIVDLSIALEYTRTPDALFQDKSHWALRYGVLLWLSLICMIPFDLAQFDEPDGIGRTASLIESLAREHLGKAGLERDAAAMLLSRFYMRRDTGSGFHAFVEWAHELFRTSDDIFTTIGFLQVVCDVVKSGSPEQIKAEESNLLALASLIDDRKPLASNSLVRKHKTKLVARLGLRMLPGSINTGRSKGRTLAGGEIIASTTSLADEEIPEEVELILEQLLQSLQDKDTIVRWSAAKGIARIAERLPTDFASQVLETILGIFAIHSIAAASLYDLPAIAESTWHGACLACAEMARRSLITSRHLPVLIDWLSKALYFDLRKGAHSIGSNVRDAASYFLWALARTQEPAALIPHASNLAKRLAAVALYDREVHIRRAASAAFQEHVGRTNLFPHGIDVLGKADFYAVSVRKNAYLVAASQVAEHPEYRQFLFDHLLDVVLRHWDLAMRELAAQSLRLICLLDLTKLGPEATSKAARLLGSVDLTDLHGGILALSEIAYAYRSNIREGNLREELLRGIFKYLTNVPESTLTTPRNDLVTSAACRLLARSVTLVEIELEERSSVPNWRKIIDVGLKHRNPSVQEAAAEAMAEISRLTDCSSNVQR